MKKNLNKIIAISTIAIASVFVFITILVSVGSLELTVFDNALVSGFIAGLALLFVAAAVISVVIAFKDDSMLKNVLLYKDNHSSTKLNAKVIIKLIKEANVTVPGVKIKKYLLSADDNGNIKLNLSIKIIDSDISKVTEALRKAIADLSKKVLNIDFISIDFKVYKVVSSFRLPKSASPKTQTKPSSPLVFQAPVAEGASEKPNNSSSDASDASLSKSNDKPAESKSEDPTPTDKDSQLPTKAIPSDDDVDKVADAQTKNTQQTTAEDGKVESQSTDVANDLSYRHSDIE